MDNSASPECYEAMCSACPGCNGCACHYQEIEDVVVDTSDDDHEEH